MSSPNQLGSFPSFSLLWSRKIICSLKFGRIWLQAAWAAGDHLFFRSWYQYFTIFSIFFHDHWFSSGFLFLQSQSSALYLPRKSLTLLEFNVCSHNVVDSLLLQENSSSTFMVCLSCSHSCVCAFSLFLYRSGLLPPCLFYYLSKAPVLDLLINPVTFIFLRQ